MVRSPRTARSKTARMERPMRRWISCVRPLCFPRAASRSLRVWVARGSMPYSAVTQPSPLPRLCGGTFSSTEAVQSTRVWPNSISTEPSAWMVKPRVMRTGRSWSAARSPLRTKTVMSTQEKEEEGSGLARSGGALDGFVDLGDRALDGILVEVVELAVGGHARLDG